MNAAGLRHSVMSEQTLCHEAKLEAGEKLEGLDSLRLRGKQRLAIIEAVPPPEAGVSFSFFLMSLYKCAYRMPSHESNKAYKSICTFDKLNQLFRLLD